MAGEYEVSNPSPPAAEIVRKSATRRTSPRRWKSSGRRTWGGKAVQKDSGAPPTTDSKNRAPRKHTAASKRLGRRVGWRGGRREFTARTDEHVERARRVMEANQRATCADALAAAGIGRSPAQRIQKRDMELKPPRKKEAQRAKPPYGGKRLEISRQWDTQIRT